jgi:hypothetical protein
VTIKRTAAAAVCLLILAGCNSNGLFQPKGRVVKGGEPIVLKPGEDLGIFFYPLIGDGQLGKTVYPAQFNAADSTFLVTGSDRHGLPSGKYRVAVELKKDKKDLYGGAFSMSSSPIVVDVDSKTGEILIDLSKPRG